MTTFTDLYNATVGNTKRPELVALTKTCVKLATLRAHQVDFWPRDYASTNLTFAIDTTLQLVTISGLTSQLPQKRTIDFLQSLDATTLQPCENLDWHEYKDFWDADGCLRSSVYTEKGDSLVFRPRVQTGKLGVNYYVNPVVAEDTFSSWIADAHQDELAMWAAGLIWARTGLLEQAKVVQDLHVTPFKDLLVASYLINTVN